MPDAPVVPAFRIGIRDVIRCAAFLAAIFAVASLGGCKLPERQYVEADAQTLKALERPLAERIAQERAHGDAEQAWIWEETLESWRDRVEEARAPEVKAPEGPPKPGPTPARTEPPLKPSPAPDGAAPSAEPL